MDGRDEEFHWQPVSLSCTCHGCFHFSITWQSPAALFSSAEIFHYWLKASALSSPCKLSEAAQAHLLLTSLMLQISDEATSVHQKVLRVPSITECSSDSKNVLAHRAFTWWVMGGKRFRLFMCFVFLITALHLTRHTAILSLYWVAWQVNPLVVQRDSETVAAVIAGLARKCTLNVLVTDSA